MFGFSKVASITTDELMEKLEQPIKLLDVREVDEYRAGHIKAARNVPLSGISSFSAPKTGTFYVICQSGMRSKRACKILTQAGFDVVNVAGGMSAWCGKVVK